MACLLAQLREITDLLACGIFQFCFLEAQAVAESEVPGQQSFYILAAGLLPCIVRACLLIGASCLLAHWREFNEVMLYV